MQENEFEKQVKSKMEELGFEPSQPVWEVIKKRIEKRKRRVLPFIFLFAIVAIGGGYFMYINNGSHIKPNNNYTSYKKQNIQSSIEERAHADTQANSTLKNAAAIKQPIEELKSKRINSINPGLIHQQSSEEKKVIAQHVTAYGLHQNKAASAGISLTNKNAITVSGNTIKAQQVYYNDSLSQSNPTYKTNTNNNQNTSGDNVLKTTTGSSANNNTVNSIAATDTSANNNSIKKDNALKQKNASNIKLKKNQNWQWGLTAMYGSSNLNNRFLNNGLSTEKSTPSSLNSGGPNVSVLKQTNKPYKTNEAFKSGIVVHKHLFKQTYLNTGLQYVYLSTKSTTAINLDSSLIAVSTSSFDFIQGNSYYRFGTEKTYNNTYHFIELPLSLQSNLFRIRQFSLSYNAGVSVMYLLSAKTLVYNSKSNSLFVDNSLLRRTQTQLLSGLSMQYNTKHAGSFLVGPQIEYSISTFLKNKDYNHLHYINYGVQASWLFNKKQH